MAQAGFLEDIPLLLRGRLTALSTSTIMVIMQNRVRTSKLSTATPTMSITWLELLSATLDTAPNEMWTLLTNSWIILVTVINPDELCFQFGWSLFFATWRRMETRSFRFICRNNIFLPAHVFTYHQFHAISHCLYQEYNKALIFFDSLLYPVFALKDKGSLNPISPGLFGSIGTRGGTNNRR